MIENQFPSIRIEHIEGRTRIHLYSFKMQLTSLVVVFLPLCSSIDIPHDVCASHVKIDDNYYNLSQTIDLGDAYPVDAHYDVYGNLFYVQSGRSRNQIIFDIYVLKVNMETPTRVLGLPEGRSYSVAVDKLYSDIYFGTQGGLYKYDYVKDCAELDSSKGLKLDMIFIDSDGNKFITESYNGIEELFFLEGEKRIRYNIIQDFSELVIDDKNNFHFIKAEQLFILRKDSLKPRFVANVTYNGIAQITFYSGKVFIASQRLSYVEEEGVMHHVENIPEKVSAIAFDNSDNFVLGTFGKLLSYKKNDCYLRKSLDDEPRD